MNNLIVGKAEVDWEMRPVQDRDAKFVKTALAEYVETELCPAVRQVHPEPRPALKPLLICDPEPMLKTSA